MSSLEIRRAVEADIPRIVDLLALGLGAGEAPRTTEFWIWKHVENPFGVSPCLLALRDGRIGAVRAFMRWDWVARSGRARTVRAVDTVTHPDFRRQGLFRSLTLRLVDECREDAIAFVFNTPNRYSKPGYLKMGWEEAGRVPILIRPLRPSGLVRALGIGSSFGAPDLSSLPTAAQVPRGVLEEVSETRSGPDGYRTPTAPSFLDWRYQRIPGVQYHAVWQESPAPALVIFRGRVRRGMSEVTVTEVLGDRSGSTALLRRLARSVKADHMAASAARRSSARGSLMAAGFLPMPRSGSSLTIRVLDRIPDPDPRRMTSWQLSLGDIELF